MNRKSLALAIAAGATLCAGLPARADNIEGPWGIQNGDLFGRARSTQIPMQFGLANLPEQAWSVNLGAINLNRPGGMGYMVFDAAGNLYMRTSTPSNTLASFATDGTLRWRAHDSIGNNLTFGTQFTAASPVVGDGAYVYILGEGNDGLVAAIQKSDGVRAWQTLLPGEPVSFGGISKTPTLYNGKIYVVGRSSGSSANVYQLDSTTGNLDWSVPLPIHGNNTGSLTLVPNIFGTGLHGLYFNINSGSGSDGIPEVYGVKINTIAQTATLEWGTEGGFVTRSHVIYSPVTNRLYTHTGGDYGGQLYTYDPLTGSVIANTNRFSKGHPNFDAAGLDFDDVSIVAGALDGFVVKYTDNGTGHTTDAVYNYPPWWSELRMYGQLLRNAQQHTVLVTGTNSKCATLGNSAELVMLDITAAHEGEDGPIYIDDISVRQGPDENNTTPVFSENFEALALGNLPGQGGWVSDNVLPGGATPAQLVNDPAGGAQGRVARMDAAGNFGGWQGAFRNFADTTQDAVVISWKQYRADLTDNVWAYFGNAPNDLSGGWMLGWDRATPAPSYFPYHFAGDSFAVVAQHAAVWQTVTVTYRGLTQPDPASRDVFVTIDDPVNGTIIGSTVTQDMGFNGTTSIQGFGLDLEATSVISGGVPNPTVAEYSSGVCSDDGFPLRGGPLIGPDGKAYYASPANNTLYAIRAGSTPPPFAGDSNCDHATNLGDVAAFALALTDPVEYGVQYPGCNLSTADINADGQVDGRDVSAFVDLLIND